MYNNHYNNMKVCIINIGTKINIPTTLFGYIWILSLIYHRYIKYILIFNI